MSRLASTPTATDATRGLLLGLAGVVMFALSIPMTRLAGGSAEAPQLDPAFVALGRAAVAGGLSLAYLALTRARRPQGREWRLLAFTAAGVVFGWPLLLGLAVRHVDAVHASVISGVLPLATAVIAALVLRQRPSAGFWAWSSASRPGAAPGHWSWPTACCSARCCARRPVMSAGHGCRPG